jgi:CNT family concentrative nucleoside transporter
MSKKHLFILFTFLLVTFFSCTDKPNVKNNLEKKWTFVSIKDSAGNEVKKVLPTDTLKIFSKQKANHFSYAIEKENIKASGSWELVDSNLIFTYDLKPLIADVDSTAYMVDEQTKQPFVVYYKNNKELTRVSTEGLVSQKIIRSYKIDTCSLDRLVIKEKGITYTFSYQSKILESDMNFNSIWRGTIGMAVLILILYLFSSNRKQISWKLVGSGLLMQLLFAIGVLKVPFVQHVFEACSNFFVKVLAFTKEGSDFVFGGLVNSDSIGFVFAFQILPTILFFSALTSLFFYLGIIQKIVYAFAWVMSKFMKLSGAESLAAAANIFLGQTEAPLLVKPYIANMNRSETLCLMVGGMATIAGGVLAAYIGFLGGDDPVQRLFFAKHLLAASVMSAPAAIVAAKILLPQTEEINSNLEITKEKIGGNALEAIANGTVEGLKLAANVAAMLLVFIALIAMLNYVMSDMIGEWTGLNAWVVSFTHGAYKSFSLQFLLGYACAPLAYLMGVCKEDMVLVGQLLGEKTILNEFVAYTTLGKMQLTQAFAEQKSIIIATYVLCGFSNFASIGIQIGGIGSLAPNKRGMLSQLGIKALIGGTIASLFTATVVGMLI